jgi:predicted transcriptional regulator
VRNAARLAAKAAEHNFSSEAELNNVRAEAGLALIGVIGGLEDGSLTEGALYRGRDAVRAWIGKLVAR